jgi:hypothetical protein
LQEASGRTVDTRYLLAGVTSARLPPALTSSIAISRNRINKVTPQFLQDNQRRRNKQNIEDRKYQQQKKYKGKYPQKVKQLTAGGGLSPQYSETTWETMVTPFRTFLMHSSTSFLVNSRAGIIREGSSALEYSKPRCSLSFS